MDFTGSQERLAHQSWPGEEWRVPLANGTTSAPAGSGAASVFRVDQARLAALRDLNWRRVRVLVWVLVVGVALGFLLLIPLVHQPPPGPLPLPSSRPALVNPRPAAPRPLWASILLVVGVGGPLLALALGLFALPALLWRAAWLRRQGELHLAIGRQGLLFFLPGQAGRWFLLPWGHIAALTPVAATLHSARRERLRTVLWRRWARLQRVFRHGRRLGASTATRRPTRSPFLLHARAAAPRARLRIACYARLPDSGYGWLFRLAPFTRRTGPTSFLLETDWFETAAARLPAVSLQQALVGLWDAAFLRAQRALLPLPRSGGAVLLHAPIPAQGPLPPEGRRVDLAAWAALLLVPALSVMLLGISLVTRQPLATGDILNLATLCTLTLGLGLLLAGMRWTRRGRLFAGGAFLLALAGALNLVYGLVVLRRDWPWTFQTAPGEPFLFLEALAGLLLALGGVALGLEGSGRPGVRVAFNQSAGAAPEARPHSTELVVALGLFALGLARVLQDINLAAISRDGEATLQWLRNTLAEPLLPLAIIGLSYFALLAGPALQTLFRALQAVYGLVLALLAPAAFLIVYRASGGTRLLPLAWLPLMALELVCGLLVVIFSLWARRWMKEPS